MKPIAQLAKASALLVSLARFVSAEPVNPPDGHFSTWNVVPEIIDSISKDSYREQLDELHGLTRIKLGYPQSSVCLDTQEHGQYMLQSKERWKQWWETTGKPVSEQKGKHAKVDQDAFQLAWTFLGTGKKEPEKILPVWIPETWTLHVTFSNGDYGGREKEVWILDRQEQEVRFTRLRGDYSDGGWSVKLDRHRDITTARADYILKSICYVHRYCPAQQANDTSIGEGEHVLKGDEMPGLYYPHAALNLTDGGGRILWNTHGYDFQKSRPEYGGGDAGRTYYFLASSFTDKKAWINVTEPSSVLLEPYRELLSTGKPSFFSNASDIITFSVNTVESLRWKPCSNGPRSRRRPPTPKWIGCHVSEILGPTRRSTLSTPTDGVSRKP
jgi:hypothetical protein